MNGHNKVMFAEMLKCRLPVSSTADTCVEMVLDLTAVNDYSLLTFETQPTAINYIAHLKHLKSFASCTLYGL